MPKYTVIEAEAMYHDDPQGLRAEYTRLRDIAHKRLQRLKDSEFSWTKTAQKVDFPKLREMNPAKLPDAFSELSKFIEATSSSVTGQKKIQAKTMETLNRAIGAYDEEDKLDKDTPHVTKANYKRVIDLFEEARKRKVTYDSAKIVELADATINVSKPVFSQILDNLDFMVEHSHEVAQLENLNGYTFDEIIEML